MFEATICILTVQIAAVIAVLSVMKIYNYIDEYK